MMPTGPLIIEHRVIRKMIERIRIESGQVAEGKAIEETFIDTAVDFMVTYADRTHLRKEENILFRDLAKKDLSPDDQRIMQELLADHVYSRQTVRELVEAKEQYVAGHMDALKIILEKLDALVSLYPAHMEKEDQFFFPAAMTYLSQSERGAMLEEMRTFDRGDSGPRCC